MALNDFWTGILLVLAAVFLFGSHTSFAKAKKVSESNVSMPIYNIYFLIGVSVSCFIEYIAMISLFGYNTIEFTYLGILSAFFILCFELFYLFAIQQIGISYAMALHVFTAVITAAAIQLLIGEPMAQMWLMIIGLLVIANSIFFMTVLKKMLHYCNVYDEQGFITEIDPKQTANDNTKTVQMSMTDPNDMTMQSDNKHRITFLSDGRDSYGVAMDESAPLISVMKTQSVAHPSLGSMSSISLTNLSMSQINLMNFPNDPDYDMISTKEMAMGFLLSSLAGVFFAIAPLPSLYAPDASSGLNFFFSFGIGCVLTTPFSGLVVIFNNNNGINGPLSRSESFKNLVMFDESVWHVKDVFFYGFGAGLVWGLGNIAGFCAYLYLEYVIVTAFIQCNIIIGLILGVLLWKEIQNKYEVGGLFVLSLMLIFGCVLVTAGVYGQFV